MRRVASFRDIDNSMTGAIEVVITVAWLQYRDTAPKIPSPISNTHPGERASTKICRTSIQITGGGPIITNLDWSEGYAYFQ